MHANHVSLGKSQLFILVKILKRPLPRPLQCLGSALRRTVSARVGVATNLPPAIGDSNTLSSRVHMENIPPQALAYAHHEKQSDTTPADAVQNDPTRCFSDRDELWFTAIFQVRRISTSEDTRVDRDVLLLGCEHTIHHSDSMLQCIDGRYNLYTPAIGRHVHFSSTIVPSLSLHSSRRSARNLRPLLFHLSSLYTAVLSSTKQNGDILDDL